MHVVHGVHIGTVPLKGKVVSLATFSLVTLYSIQLTQMSLKHSKWLSRDKNTLEFTH